MVESGNQVRGQRQQLHSTAQHRSGGEVSGIDSSTPKENFPYVKCGNRSKQALEFTSRRDEAEGKTSGNPKNLWEQMP